jgi:hypothetical protein
MEEKRGSAPSREVKTIRDWKRVGSSGAGDFSAILQEVRLLKPYSTCQQLPLHAPCCCELLES